MKLSTRLKKADPCVWVTGSGLEFYNSPLNISLKIVFMVDCKRVLSATFLQDADRIHSNLLKEGYKPLWEESPVFNGHEIIVHYTSSTYNEWCEK